MSSEDPKLSSPSHAGSEPREAVKRDVTELIKMVVLFLIVFGALKAFVIEGYEVQGDSMVPTLEDRERILVFKLPTKLARLPLIGGFQPLHDGDIVVFESPVENNKRYIKRIIAQGPATQRDGNTVVASEEEGEATPGRVQVTFDQGAVFVNNRRVEEPYLVSEERKSPDVRQPVYLDAGEYYVLGDHRSVSKDSRSFKAVKEEQIIGKAVLRIWPLSSFGFL